MPENRRSSNRHEVSIEATLTVAGQPNEVTIVNLSLGGALLTGARQKMGTRAELGFNVPAMDERVEVGATVRWSDASGIGIQFDGLRARDVWALNEYFKLLG